MSADLYVECDCSSHIFVTPAKCGCTVLCRCGRRVPVPTLGELRSRAGLPKLRSSAVHRIERLDANGELPPEPDCVACGRSTNDSLVCSVQYEAKAGRFLDLLPKPILFLFTPIWFVPLIQRSMALQEAAAEDQFIDIRVRLCGPCLGDLPRNKQAIRLIASKTELYADLFREYPLAVIRSVQRKFATSQESQGSDR